MSQHTSIIDHVVKTIRDAEVALRESAANDIISRREESPDYAETLNAIKLIARLNDVLMQGGMQASASFQLGFSIKSNLKGKRLTSVVIDGEHYRAKYLRDVSRIVFEWLCMNFEDELLGKLDQFKAGANNEPFASLDPDSIQQQGASSIQTKSGKTIYIDPYRMTVNNMCALRGVLKSLGIDQSRISVCVDESYHRQSKDPLEVSAG